MKQIKILGVLAIALTLGLSACGNGGNNDNTSEGGDATSSRHQHYAAEDAPWQSDDSKHWKDCAAGDGGKVDNKSHTFGDPYDVHESTCKVKGTQKVKCTVCQREVTQELPLKDHEYIADTSKTNVEATCEEDGHNYLICKNCNEPKDEVVTKLGHNWVKAEDQTGAFAATCTEAGTEIQECSRCHKKQSVAVAALGHDFPETGTKLPIPDATEKNTKGEIPFHWAEITNYSCSRGDSYRYAWSAKEVNFDYENEGVHFTQEEIDAAQAGDAAYGKSTSDWKSEPNLLDDGEGVRFFGRPINNAMELNSAGDAANRGDTPKVPDPSVKGSRFEFDFVFDTDVEDVCLSAEFTPAQYTSDVFKNADNTEDWTPGYKDVQPAVDGEGNPVLDEAGNPTYTGEIIKPFRFYILLDGEEIVLDKNVSTPANGRGWYQFPCKLNLTAGKHNLNIAMSGGYRHIFYQFSFEKVAPAHEHRFGEGTAQTDEVESKVAQCACGVEQIRWDAQKFNAEASSGVDKDQAALGEDKGAKLSGDVYNKTKGTASVGAHAVYNVNAPAAKTDAKLLIKGVRTSSAVGMFSAQSNDNSKSYYEKTAGEEWVQYEWRYKLYVNDVEVEFTPYTTDNPEPKTVRNEYVEFAFPCTFNLKQGVNKIELQKWGGYTLIITELAFEY